MWDIFGLAVQEKANGDLNGGIGVIDQGNHTAFHLEAVQTPSKLDNKSLLDLYGELLFARKDSLFEILKDLEVYQAVVNSKSLKRNINLVNVYSRKKDLWSHKLNFHFNTSLTALNLDKTAHWLKTPKEERETFSMASVKTVYHNQLLLDRFLDMFAIDPNSKKNKNRIRQLPKFGVIAA